MGSFLDEITDDKLESFKQEEFVKVKDNRIKIASIIGGAIATLIIITTIIVSFLNNVNVPDMTDWTITEVQVWTNENNIKVIPAEEYNFADKDTVVYQSIKAGEKIDKGDSIQITFSKGPNPNELIEVPDIASMNEAGVKEWIKQNKLTGVSFKYEYSTAFEKDQVIKYDFIDGTNDQFKRKNRIQVTISKGKETISDLIEVPKFIDLLESQATKWASDNDIEIVVEYINDDYVLKGKIISQSVNQGYKIRRGDTLTIYVSLGKTIEVPDFEFYSKSEAESWASKYDINIKIEEQYSSSIPRGHFVSQSINHKEEISEGDEIVIVYSLGKIDIYSYIGRSILDFKNFVEEENMKGANLTYSITYEASTSHSNGSIISHDYEHKEVSPGTTINVVVSIGNTITVPDFADYTVEQTKEWANENNVNLVIKYEYSRGITEGYAKRQSIKKKTVINGGDEIVVYFSLGLVNIDSFEGMTITEMRNTIDELNRLGANLDLQEEFVFNSKPNGTVISHEYTYDEVLPGTAIGVIVSKGEAFIVPDFVNNTSINTFSTALEYCNENNLICTWKFDKGGTTNQVVSQSVQANTAIGKREEIEIHISLG